MLGQFGDHDRGGDLDGWGAAVLIDRFRAKKGVKKMVGAGVRVETPALLDEALKREAKGVYAGTQSALQHPNKRVTALDLDVGATQQ